MNIVVCLKRVPETAEADLRIDDSKKGIVEDRLAFDVNESDNYALEEAIQLKEKLGGKVILVSLGPDTSEEVLRMGLAKGADEAIRLTDQRFSGSDAHATARILSSAVTQLEYDLIFTGCMATDDGYTQVGVTLAEMLKIPHAALITGLELQNGSATVKRELEGGLAEMLEVKLPALFTVQTGINEPRYASLISIKRAASREIKVLGLETLGLTEEDVGERGSKTLLEGLSPPPAGKKAEILEGSPDETSSRLSELLKEKGVL